MVVVAVVLVVLLVGAVAIWAKRTKHLCWKNTPQPNTSGTSNGRLYENHDTAARVNVILFALNENAFLFPNQNSGICLSSVHQSIYSSLNIFVSPQ